MKTKVYLFLILLLNVCALANSYGQADPGSTGLAFDKSVYMVNETGYLDVNIGNYSAGTAVTPGDAEFTVNIPNTMRVNGPIDLSAMPFQVVISSQSVDGAGTTVIIFTVPQGIPGGMDDVFSIPVIGHMQGGSLNAIVSIEPNITTASGNALTTNDGQSSPVVVTGVLPVTLTSFSVSKEGGTALLAWATTAESNSDYFEVQHSLNAKNWVSLGTVKSFGESVVLRKYSYPDATPSNGLNYYRLKMVDKDGTFAYSTIRNVVFEGLAEGTVSVFPNPASDRLFVNNAEINKVKTLCIVTQDGKELITSPVSASGVSIKGLQPGLYLVKLLSQDGALSTHKLVIGK